ncbi:uncharacterized protein LOC122395741 [Colletes gigas]|uniref:uncharacterized protein LOC122395741 n=1 Tax=Colletes gigas TaxID=935657 RepID=UPI001C9A74A5|nr:uncharacterized protein LOC122395741 [Colletes gigas]
MCSTSAMGYYVPIMQDDGVSPCKENTFNRPRQPSRVMVRRYALTSMGSKYLEIGISVGPIADVEILLGDNHGNHPIIPWHTWNTQFDSCTTIEERAQLPGSSLMRIDELTVEFCQIFDSPIVKMTMDTKSLYFKPNTVKFLFNLEPCVSYVYPRLYQTAEDVRTKFKTFVNVLQQSDADSETLDTRCAAKIIRDREYYCKDYLVDCELLGCAINDIVVDARRKKCNNILSFKTYIISPILFTRLPPSLLAT